MKRIYLDCAATTPLDREVEKAMRPYFSSSGKFGNPNSLHYFGQAARGAIDEAREKIAKVLGALPTGGFREIIFTGSATEANNLALRGILKSFRFQISRVEKEIPRIIVSAIEHESVLETARDLENEGAEVVYLPVNRHGRVDLRKLKEALNERTILVSVMYANNEIGVIQPIAEISSIIRNFRNSKGIYPLFHTDAAQAFQFLNCDVNVLGADLMTLSAHKIYGPKGIGLLYARYLKSVTYDLKPVITGGGQEFGWRSGTENVPAIIGFARSIELAAKNREKETEKIAGLADYFWRELKKIYPGARLNNAMADSAKQFRHLAVSSSASRGGGNVSFLPNILNIYFSKQSAEELLIRLDLKGVAVSRGSACVSFSAKPSYVLAALGHPKKRINSSLRFSFGKFTTKEELVRTLKILRDILV